MNKKVSLYDFKRMCDSYESCNDCPILLHDELKCCLEFTDIDAINNIVYNWCNKHPIKTRQSELLKAFPNIKINISDEAIDICPLQFEKNYECENILEKLSLSDKTTCVECRKKYWLSEK